MTLTNTKSTAKVGKNLSDTCENMSDLGQGDTLLRDVFNILM